MATGDTQDILYRFRGLLPARWWSNPAPIRDAILGGMSDVLAWGYSLIAYAKTQMRLATASNPILDVAAYDFLGLTIARKTNDDDTSFRLRVRREIVRERVSRAGVSGALKDLTGYVPLIQAPWNPGDTCAWDVATASFPYAPGWDSGFWDSSVFWIDQWIAAASAGVGYWDSGACWGDLYFVAQVFITAFRPPGGGVPYVPGWDSGFWDSPVFWIDQSMAEALLPDGEIYACVSKSLAAGVVAWVQILNPPVALAADDGAIFADESGRTIVF